MRDVMVETNYITKLKCISTQHTLSLISLIPMKRKRGTNSDQHINRSFALINRRKGPMDRYKRLIDRCKRPISRCKRPIIDVLIRLYKMPLWRSLVVVLIGMYASLAFHRFQVRISGIKPKACNIWCHTTLIKLYSEQRSSDLFLRTRVPD